MCTNDQHVSLPDRMKQTIPIYSKDHNGFNNMGKVMFDIFQLPEPTQ